VDLLADRWAPRAGDGSLPTALIRSPYGRAGLIAARNPGTGKPHATVTTLRAADQRVYHDPARPSAIILPVRPDHRPPAGTPR
jgi:predicted acyl esterase